MPEHLRPSHLERIEAPRAHVHAQRRRIVEGSEAEARVPVGIGLLQERDTSGRAVVLGERPGVQGDTDPCVAVVEEPVADPPVHDRVLDDVVERLDEHEAAEAQPVRQVAARGCASCSRARTPACRPSPSSASAVPLKRYSCSTNPAASNRSAVAASPARTEPNGCDASVVGIGSSISIARTTTRSGERAPPPSARRADSVDRSFYAPAWPGTTGAPLEPTARSAPGCGSSRSARASAPRWRAWCSPTTAPTC